ncbi:hypothetical protein SAMN05421871_102204 [Actinokineospora alba]|nr:hypothetical protein SAMN05421871_102204 [Actinokineospora alba]
MILHALVGGDTPLGSRWIWRVFVERGSRPIDSAADVIGSILRARTRSTVPAIVDLIEAIRTWETIRFDVSMEGDSDGFLFQFGSINWTSVQVFAVSFVRQFELRDADGEREALSQVSLEYHYPLDGELDSITSHHSWWFRSDASPFSAWLTSVEQNSLWKVLRSKQAVGFEVSQEWV